MLAPSSAPQVGLACSCSIARAALAVFRARIALVMALTAVGFILAAPAAVAGRQDTASDHVALRALQRYMQANLPTLPAARQSDDAFVASITASCPNVLAALNLLPPSAFNEGTVTALGEEIGLDAGFSTYAPLQPPLAVLAAALERLRWSSPKTAAKIKHALDGLHRIFTHIPSELCADARAVASTNFQTTPSATSQFIANAGASLNGPGVGGLARVLGAFRTRADQHVFANIMHLIGQSQTAFEAQGQACGTKLEIALGLRS
jgi:hypothetical protein